MNIVLTPNYALCLLRKQGAYLKHNHPNTYRKLINTIKNNEQSKLLS